MAEDNAWLLHGCALPATPLVLDSPHSGTAVPGDMRAAVSDFDLADATDCFVDELWLPATERGVGLLAARAVRTYIDCNRNAGDVDLDLVAGGVWPDAHAPSGKARIGKALVWRTLDDGRPIYDRKLAIDEIRRRIERHHAPYHRALAERIDATHARFGASWHIDCHSMNAIGGEALRSAATASGGEGAGGAGVARADIVLGDLDGTSCEPGFTAFVAEVMSGLGYEVKLNDPFRGAELIHAYADPARRRSSLQIEVNKRLYMNEATKTKHAGFARLQRDLATLIDAVLDHAAAGLKRTPA